MPRYHFNARDSNAIPDPEGTVLPDDEAAREAGLTYLAELLLEKPELLWPTGAFQVTVTDDAGLCLFVFDVGLTTSPAAAVARKPRQRSSPG
jgi:hypothetical protein